MQAIIQRQIVTVTSSANQNKSSQSQAKRAPKNTRGRQFLNFLMAALSAPAA
jgi:hypothetical protein